MTDEKKAEEKPTTNTAQIKTIGREIYFYSAVNEESVLALLEQLKQIDQGSTPLEIEYQVPIRLHVYSGGGDLMAVFGLIDQMTRLRSPIHSVVSGMVASAATFITMSCPKRYITQNSFMLIHQIRSAMWGTYSQFQDELRLLTMLTDRMVHFYVKYSKINEDTVRNMLERDTWFSAGQALRYGLIDEVL